MNFNEIKCDWLNLHQNTSNRIRSTQIRFFWIDKVDSRKLTRIEYSLVSIKSEDVWQDPLFSIGFIWYNKILQPLRPSAQQQVYSNIYSLI